MNDTDHASQRALYECEPLLKACTLNLYRENAFRVTGLVVDASARDIKRRLDDAKHANEVDDDEDLNTHAFALKPPPDIEAIRSAELRLKDPEVRMVDELFWFWPMQLGNGKRDIALQALSNGDQRKPRALWAKALSDGCPDEKIVAKHNLAVLYHMFALEGEIKNIEQRLTTETMALVEKYWRTSFQWWEDLTEDEGFWSLVTTRIREINDPRLTTGFARRMKAALPEAFDKINADLALKYLESGKIHNAQQHIQFMHETHQGLDDVPKTMALISKPLKDRVRNAIERAESTRDSKSEPLLEVAQRLSNEVTGELSILCRFLPENDYDRVDLCDTVAQFCLTTGRAISHEEEGISEEVLTVLRLGQGFAASEEMKDAFADDISLVGSLLLLEEIEEDCKQAQYRNEREPAKGFDIAEELLESTTGANGGNGRFKSLETPEVDADVRERAYNTVAAAVAQCAIACGNATHAWEKCSRLLDVALNVAVDDELRVFLQKNLQTTRQNALVQSAPRGQQVPSSSHQRTTADPVAGLVGCGVIALIVVGISWIGSLGGESSTGSRGQSTTAPKSSSYVQRPAQPSRLESEIDAAKTRASQLESELQSMDARLADWERQLEAHERAGRLDQYNRLVNPYNTLLQERNSVYFEYDRLIDDINAKVNRFNAGAR